MTLFGDDRLPERFWDKVHPEPMSGCWLWTASNNEKGYGQVRWGRKVKKAHRVSYSELVGAIPDGLSLDHLCRVRCCVNPEHIDPVTHMENVRRGFWGNITHCSKGHEFTPETTSIRTRVKKSGLGAWRRCKICDREKSRLYRMNNPDRVREYHRRYYAAQKSNKKPG